MIVQNFTVWRYPGLPLDGNNSNHEYFDDVEFETLTSAIELFGPNSAYYRMRSFQSRNLMNYKNVNFMNDKILDMEGILFLTDDDNKKKYVQIDLEKYGEIWSEFYDILIAESRKNDEKIPLDEVKRMFKANEL
jgi:hypothetical protein